MPETSPVSRQRLRRLASACLLAAAVGTGLWLAAGQLGRSDNHAEQPVSVAARPLLFLVTNPDGHPVAGASLAIEAGNTCHQAATTDAAGLAQSPSCLAGPVVVTTEAAGLARAVTTIPWEKV